MIDDLLGDLVGQRALARVPVSPLGQDGRVVQIVAEHERVLDDPAQAKRGQLVDGPGDVVRVVQRHLGGEGRFGLGHQPQPGLGRHAEVRLHERLIPPGSKAVLIVLPPLRAGHGAQARAHQRAVGQGDLHAADLGGVVAIGGVAESTLQRVAQHAAPGVARDRHPQGDAFAVQVFVEIEEADSRLDDAIGVLLVHLKDAVHPPHVQDHRAGDQRRRIAVAEVLAAGHRPDGHAPLVGDAQDRLHLFGRLRRYHRRGYVVRAVAGRIGV